MEQEQSIQNQYTVLMNDLGRFLDNRFNPDSIRHTGFALLVFPFGQPNDDHRVNYISNVNREDMLACMKEFIARAEGRYVEMGAKK
jgi:hypothetical protein